ncbi:MAG: SpoIIE family protein phosphatase [Lachnospiraceae bacterium]|nr:SpoIIE family protein phosphatase [Lachnospiraceae bacterium]
MKRNGIKLPGTLRTWLKDGIDRETAGVILRHAGFLLLGRVLAAGTLGYGARPMGFALLTAAGAETPAVTVGVVLWALFSARNAAVPVFTAILLLAARFVLPLLWEKRGTGREGFVSGLTARFYGRERSFDEFPLFRLALLELGLFAVGLGELIGGGMLYYDLFGMLIAMGTAPFFLAAFLAALKENTGKKPVWKEIGQTVLLLSVVAALRTQTLFGFSPAAVAGFFLTLLIALYGGSLRGGVFGILSGFLITPAAGISFALAGLVTGFFRRTGKGISVFVGFLTASVLLLRQEGFGALSALVPDLAAAAAILLPLVKWTDLGKRLCFTEEDGYPEEMWNAQSVGRARQSDRSEREAAVTEAFRSLSGVFSELSEKMKRPDPIEARAIVDKTYEKFCSRCPLSTNCWVREHGATNDAMNHIAGVLCKNAAVTEEDVPGYLAERCRETPKIVRELHFSLTEVLEEAAKSDKLSLLAFDYEAIGKLLSEAYAEEAREEEADPKTAAKIRRAAAVLGLNASAVSVYGKRRLFIAAGGLELAKTKMSPDRIRDALGAVCRTALTLPDFEVSGDYVTMTLRSARKFAVTCSTAEEARECETVNGDSCASFEGKDDYFYFLISDGMGSGADAAMTSGMCVTFLKTMLTAGNPIPVVLEMLSELLRAKKPECFATVDLLRVDLLSGDASFFKSGAAPSYVLREGRLFRLTSRSMPVGIVKKLNTERIDFSLEEGDVIVMLSDGIAVGFEDSLALADILTYRYTPEDTLDSMCRKILIGSETVGHDDMTVGMLKIGLAAGDAGNTENETEDAASAVRKAAEDARWEKPAV